jgi:hypothetical protein
LAECKFLDSTAFAPNGAHFGFADRIPPAKAGGWQTVAATRLNPFVPAYSALEHQSTADECFHDPQTRVQDGHVGIGANLQYTFTMKAERCRGVMREGAYSIL